MTATTQLLCFLMPPRGIAAMQGGSPASVNLPGNTLMGKPWAVAPMVLYILLS